MAETTTLIRVPPSSTPAVQAPVTPPPAVKPAETPPAPVNPTVKATSQTAPAFTPSTTTTKDPLAALRTEMLGSGTKTVAEDKPMEVTPLHTVAYYSYLLNGVVFLLAGIFFISQATKNKAKVRFAPMIAYGIELLLLSAIGFGAGMLYYGHLYEKGGDLSIAPQGFAWALLAPGLFYVFSKVVTVSKQDSFQYKLMFVMSALVFLLIGVSQLPMLPKPAQLAMAFSPFLCSLTLSWLLFSTLGSLSESMTGKLRSGFTMVIFTIIGGWCLYPVINVVSLLVDDRTLARLLVNSVDLVLMIIITMGLYESVSNKHGYIRIKPTFSKAALSKDVEDDEDDEDDLPAAPANSDASRQKPLTAPPFKPLAPPPGAPGGTNSPIPPKAGPPRSSPTRPSPGQQRE